MIVIIKKKFNIKLNVKTVKILKYNFILSNKNLENFQ